MLCHGRRRRHAIDALNVVLDAENFLAVEFHVHEGLIAHGEPEVADFFVLTHEIGSLDPKGRILCRMSGNSDDRELLALNPYLSFEEILVSALGKSFDNETAMRAEMFFAKQTKSVVRGTDRAVTMVLSCGSGGFGFH